MELNPLRTPTFTGPIETEASSGEMGRGRGSDDVIGDFFISSDFTMKGLRKGSSRQDK